MKNVKNTRYECLSCGFSQVKWFGKCPKCGGWDIEEALPEPDVAEDPRRSLIGNIGGTGEPKLLSELEMPDYIRSKSGMSELDRVLGGGIVSGSAVLISGEPGIGKSTLLMQISGTLTPKNTVLYVSGEESGSQLRMRAKRLGVETDKLYILIETNIDSILGHAEKLKPDIIIIDSIQTIYDPRSSSSPGSITQVRECASRFIGMAKSRGISIIIVSHINKEGAIAGPKVLEHAVDAVLYFEGEKRNSYRIIRAIKNRFGSTNEIGVFEMTEKGLIEIPNPSEALLSGRPADVSGSCAVCVMEGTRPLIAEIQALAVRSVIPTPRRTSNGIDYNRLYMLLAVLEKRIGVNLGTLDVYLNVVGGLHIDEPASDMAVALAVISSVKDKPLSDKLVAMGEIGLAGECRSISNIDARISEAVRLGFNTIVIPNRDYVPSRHDHKGVKIIPVRSVMELILPPNSIF